MKLVEKKERNKLCAGETNIELRVLSDALLGEDSTFFL
jgi:hypothetical protein